MGLFSKLFNKADTLGEWLQSTSDEELEDGYEERRQAWLKEGGTTEMQRINREINRRFAENGKRIHIVILILIFVGRMPIVGTRTDFC